MKRVLIHTLVKSPSHKGQKSRKSILIYVMPLLLILAIGVFFWFYFFDTTMSQVGLGSYLPEVMNPNKTEQSFKLVIKKINLSVPVIENVEGNQKNVYENSLKGGVAHLKGSALPGQNGKTIIFGHSGSNELLNKYGEVFDHLNSLDQGDKITLFYHGQQFDYTVYDETIVEANDDSSLESNDTTRLILMTCWPIGTTDKRLLILAR